LTRAFQIAPHLARHFKVELDPQGNPIPKEITTAAKIRGMNLL